MENKTDFISLKDFVKGTISDIAEAIKELNTGDDLVVNPYDRHFPNGCREDTIAGNGAYISYVEFNVEIASVESTQNEGGVTIKVLSGNVGKKTIQRIIKYHQVYLTGGFPARKSKAAHWSSQRFQSIDLPVTM